MAQKHVIVTCCDARYGEFLIQHWLRSLQANVDLTGVDVVVLDYGLTECQRATLRSLQVICFPCVKDGVVCNLRYRDMCRLFDDTEYDQVLSIDSGDVIFQADIRPLFDVHQDQFRGVVEDLQIPFNELLIGHSDIKPDRCKAMLRFLRDRPTVNAGAIWGPARGFRKFLQFYNETCSNFNCFGVDQMVLNYLLYQEGFQPIDRGYNFVLVSCNTKYSIRDGVFYDQVGRTIPIVHNAGNRDVTRVINNFGYGPGHNRQKKWLPMGVKILVNASRAWKGLTHLLHPNASNL